VREIGKVPGLQQVSAVPGLRVGRRGIGTACRALEIVGEGRQGHKGQNPEHEPGTKRSCSDNIGSSCNATGGNAGLARPSQNVPELQCQSSTS